MLEPITKIIIDNSYEKTFSFIFHCDICENPWEIGFNSVSWNVYKGDEKQSSPAWENDHAAAYERANLEAMQHFNRCPICRRWVCDECFCLLGDRDVCKECAKSESIDQK